jgi:uncharacterized protein YecE (DUF72 family)
MPARMAALLVGCAGWHYDDWKGVVYPPHLAPARWLPHYARLFPVVEVDATFYRLPQPATVQSWLERVGEAPQFTFATKLNQEATHEHLPAGRLEAARDIVRKQLEVVIEPLERAGRFEAVLVQLPPGFTRVDRAGSQDALDALCEVVEALEPRRRHVAVEFRHASWYQHLGEESLPEVVDAFSGLRAAIVRVDGLGFAFTRSRTTPWSYFRLHGRRSDIPPSERDLAHARYNYLYSREEIAGLAQTIRRVHDGDERTTVIFNNHYQGQGARNAADLTAALGLPPPAVHASVPKESRLDDFL